MKVTNVTSKSISEKTAIFSYFSASISVLIDRFKGLNMK